jgi:hypothetical protein
MFLFFSPKDKEPLESFTSSSSFEDNHHKMNLSLRQTDNLLQGEILLSFIE